MMSESEQTIAVGDIAQQPERVFALNNEDGAYAQSDCETIYAPILEGRDAELLVIEQADGWRAGRLLKLPDAALTEPPRAVDWPRPSLLEAITNTCHALITGCA